MNNKRTTLFFSAGLFVWAVLCIFVVCLFLSYSSSKAATQYGCITQGRTNVYFRETPGGSPITDNGKTIMLNGGQELEIIDTSNSSWYKVTLVYNRTTYTGYVSSTYITIYDNNSTTEAATQSSAGSSDTDFENYMTAQGFPESYKPYLRKLHETHPNWVFKAVQTGLDWETVVDNEVNKTGQIKNLVNGTSSTPRYNWRSTTVGYNYKTDTWSSYDSTTWFAASDALVTYYLDPRTYLSETYVFAFEELTYDSSQTETGVEAILAGTFMANTKPSGSTSTYAQLMVQAGKAAGVSPYHIASKIKQEIGSTISTATSGTNSTYPGIYNFYNIGAFDSSSSSAAVAGLKWAATSGSYGRPWNTVYKSIYGGALYIGNNYILKGQNTIYTEKFNVTYTANLYSHQYMTNVQAAATEAAKVYTAYSGSKMLNNTITFCIPVYKNMPDTASKKPADSGNPNNYLKTLTIKGYTLTPTFAINTTTSYSLIVASTVSSITVSATTVNANASISGTGTITLSQGTNKINIVVTAQNGDKRTYTLTVVRGTSTGTTSVSPSYSGSYIVSGGGITGVSPKTTVNSFISKLGCTNGTVSITDYSGNAKSSSDYIGTGDRVKVVVNGTTTNYMVVIYGDVNGDGQINALDLLKVQKHLMGAATLPDPYLTAANIKRSGNVSALDLLKIQKYLMGAANITQ